MNEIMTMRTELANQFAAAGAKLLDFTMTAGALAAIPNTTPQQYAVASTLETITKVLPAAKPSHPARRLRHGDRPTEPLSFDDAPAAPAVPDLTKLPTFKSIVGEECVRLVDVQKWIAAAPAVQVIDAPRVEDDEKRIVTAARALSKLAAESCQVNEADMWKLHSEDFKVDAAAALAAADALPIARQAQPTDRDAVLADVEEAVEQVIRDLEFDAEERAGAYACRTAIRALKAGGSTTEGAAS